LKFIPQKRNVRATFFLLGELAIKQPDLVKKTYDYGHTIGSHTYDHKNLKKLDDEQLLYEIDSTNEILKNIIGEEIKFIRPPYGAYNQDILNKVNMSFILWSVDTEDWKLRNAEKIAQFMVDNIQDGDIVLLHDIHAETIDGVIQGIDLLKEQGFEFVSLEELIEYRKIKLETNTAYRHFKPKGFGAEIVEDNTSSQDVLNTEGN
jgi:peptidoglycan/xylan/chitin deacetylase (PgdA/CDA1 family)